MGGDDKNRATHVFLAAQSPALKFTSDSSQNLKTRKYSTVICLSRRNFTLAVFQKLKSLAFLCIFLPQYFFRTCQVLYLQETYRERFVVQNLLKGKSPLFLNLKVQKFRVICQNLRLGQNGWWLSPRVWAWWLQKAAEFDDFRTT